LTNTLCNALRRRYLGDVDRSIDNTLAAEIVVDRKADVPVGVQLDWALSARIRDGRLRPGEQLPTLRDMAAQTGLNVNTVRAVYRRLEQRGLVESQHGSGTFVAGASPRGAGALSSIAANAANEARETGLDPRDVAAALYVAPAAEPSSEPPSSTPAQPSAADRRSALRGQIATLERTIAELEADHPGVAPSPRRSRRGVGPALLSGEELAHVRATLIRRLAVVQGAIDEQAEASPHEAAKRPARTRKATAKARVKAVEDEEPASAQSKPARKTRPTARPAPAGG